MQSKPGTAGFSLLELLAVIGITAILASLLLLGLSGAKSKAQSVRCKSNLRQIALAQSFYLTDHGVYPFSQNGAWLNLLSSQLGENILLGGCPAAVYVELPLRWAAYDYGFNAYGFNDRNSNDWMGGLGFTFTSIDAYNPVREADVVNPANMIAFADSVVKVRREPILWLGFHWIGSATGTGLPNDTAQVYKRHSTRLNTAFADAHVEAPKVDALYFSNEDRDRRRWFRDDQPHPEWIE